MSGQKPFQHTLTHAHRAASLTCAHVRAGIYILSCFEFKSYLRKRRHDTCLKSSRILVFQRQSGGGGRTSAGSAQGRGSLRLTGEVPTSLSHRPWGTSSCPTGYPHVAQRGCSSSSLHGRVSTAGKRKGPPRDCAPVTIHPQTALRCPELAHLATLGIGRCQEASCLRKSESLPDTGRGGTV